jgi:hypothetical protein
MGVQADGASSFTAVAAGSAGTTIHGQYGDLTIHQDGSYSYARAAGSPGGVSEVFRYQLTDGDGDVSTTSLTVSIGNDTPTVTVTPSNPDVAGNGVVDEAGLATGTNPGASATTTGLLSYTAGDGPDTIKIGSTTITAVGQTITGTHGTLTITSIDTANHTIGYSYTLTSPLSVAGAGANNEGAGDTFAVSVTDVDGSVATGSLAIDVIDDTPHFASAPDSFTHTQAIGSTVGTSVTGNLNFVSGADGASSAVVAITASTTATADGHTLSYHQVGSTLYAFEDVTGNGYTSDDTTQVFHITEDPTTGQYSFTLDHALDPAISRTQIGGATAFGAGPAGEQVLTTGAKGTGTTESVISGGTTAGFDINNWTPQGSNAHDTAADVNGSVAGWGVKNNNFDTNELLHFDFHHSATDSSFTGPLVSYAEFEFPGFSAGDHIYYKAFYEDALGNIIGSSAPTLVTDAQLASTTQTGDLFVQAPTGEYLAYVELFDQSGLGKVQLVAVGTTSSTVDQTITFTTTLADGDGDQTTSGNFSIEVSSSATPIVLDLNHDGVQFVGEDAGHIFNYGAGDVSTAWAAPGDGVLALETANGPVVSFTGFVQGATTDLQGLAAFDSNHNGMLDSGDAQWSHFGAIVDGQFESLAQLGVASINLASDGQSYTAANGQVQVSGSGTFAYTNGATGALADASFATQPKTTSTTSATSGTTTDTAYGDSLAVAAGVVAAAVLTEPPPADAQTSPTPTVTTTATTTTVVQTDDTQHTVTSTTSGVEQTTAQTTTNTATTSDSGHSSSTDSGIHSYSVDGGHGVHGGHVPTPLQAAASTTGAEHGAVPPPVKLAILDGSSLPAIHPHGSGQHAAAGGANAPGGDGAAQPQGQGGPGGDAGKVAAAVADSLHGGAQGGPDLNQLIDTLKGGQAPANDSGGHQGASQPHGPVHTGLAYLDLHTGASEAVNAALHHHHLPMVAHDVVSGAHHA